MCRFARLSLVMAIALPTLLVLGCNAPDPLLRQSQLQSRRMWEQNRMLANRNAQTAQSAAAAAAEKERLAQEAARLQAQLQTEQQRLANMQRERSELHDRVATLISRNNSNPLPADAVERFRKLAEQFPEFEFDPQTGVSKFHTDILFASGSAQLKPQASSALHEFARILNDGDAQRLNILVVGHTDDQRIARQTTAKKHPTNWHLSTNRANAVLLELARAGLEQDRMGACGYGMYQPLVPNKDDRSREQNRRVEIYVLAPDAVVTGWDPKTRS